MDNMTAENTTQSTQNTQSNDTSDTIEVEFLCQGCQSAETVAQQLAAFYAVIDNGTPQARVWTGSSNWTDDSWTLQESNLILLSSQEVAEYFTNDFNESWADGNIVSSGAMDSGNVTLQYAGQPAQVNISFAPNDGHKIDAQLTQLISQTQQRLTIAAVVLTSGSMIGALQSLVKRGIPIDGIYDATQMEGVMYQWQMVPANHWKISAWQQIHLDLVDQSGLERLLCYVGAGYVDSARLVESKEQYQVRLVGPLTEDSSWQARAGTGYAAGCFAVDWEAQKVSCPQGQAASARASSGPTYRLWQGCHPRSVCCGNL